MEDIKKIKMPKLFSGVMFAEKYELDIDDFEGDQDGYLICKSLPDLQASDLEDCCFDIWDTVRVQRDELLKESDFSQLDDSPVDKQAWKTYRKALRDITDDFENPEGVVFPKKP